MEELGDATEYHHTANSQVHEPTARYLVRSAFKAQKQLRSREKAISREKEKKTKKTRRETHKILE